MWFAIPVGHDWVELREGPTRPIKEVHVIDTGEGRPAELVTYRGGICRGVVKFNHFVNVGGIGIRQLKKISAKVAEEVLAK